MRIVPLVQEFERRLKETVSGDFGGADALRGLVGADFGAFLDPNVSSETEDLLDVLSDQVTEIERQKAAADRLKGFAFDPTRVETINTPQAPLISFADESSELPVDNTGVDTSASKSFRDQNVDLRRRFERERAVERAKTRTPVETPSDRLEKGTESIVDRVFTIEGITKTVDDISTGLDDLLFLGIADDLAALALGQGSQNEPGLWRDIIVNVPKLVNSDIGTKEFLVELGKLGLNALVVAEAFSKGKLITRPAWSGLAKLFTKWKKARDFKKSRMINIAGKGIGGPAVIGGAGFAAGQLFGGDNPEISRELGIDQGFLSNQLFGDDDGGEAVLPGLQPPPDFDPIEDGVEIEGPFGPVFVPFEDIPGFPGSNDGDKDPQPIIDDLVPSEESEVEEAELFRQLLNRGTFGASGGGSAVDDDCLSIPIRSQEDIRRLLDCLNEKKKGR